MLALMVVPVSGVGEGDLGLRERQDRMCVPVGVDPLDGVDEAGHVDLDGEPTGGVDEVLGDGVPLAGWLGGQGAGCRQDQHRQCQQHRDSQTIHGALPSQQRRSLDRGIALAGL